MNSGQLLICIFFLPECHRLLKMSVLTSDFICCPLTLILFEGKYMVAADGE